jgi:hypothetical protein
LLQIVRCFSWPCNRRRLTMSVLAVAAQVLPCDLVAQIRSASGTDAEPMFHLPPLLIGASVEAAYDALRVPPHLADPCVLDRDDMTVSCNLGLAGVYGMGRRLPADVLPVPADSVRLSVLSEARLVIGFKTFYTAPSGVLFDSLSRAVHRTLERKWGRPSDTADACGWWSSGRNTAATVWGASLCTFAERRTIMLVVSASDADAARAYFRSQGRSLPRPLAPRDLPLTDEPWWVPLWRPLALGDMQPGRTAERLAAVAGVAMGAARCRRPEARYAPDSLRVDCEWAQPRLEVAGLRPTLLRLNVMVDPERQKSNAYGVWLTFGTFSRTKAAVLEECRAVASALVTMWGPPTKQSSESDECDLEWRRPPFIADLTPMIDDPYRSPDRWALLLFITVQPEAVPPEAWQR